ncbi:SNX8 protein, partial [Polypterus senegalus]
MCPPFITIAPCILPYSLDCHKATCEIGERLRRHRERKRQRRENETDCEWTEAEMLLHHHIIKIRTVIPSSVPPYYREVYEAVCCKQDDRVQAEVFHRLLSRTDLPASVQTQIGSQLDCKEGFLSKLSLYKGLALIALAQQGKQPSQKLLENYTQEFPKPHLGELVDLQALKMQSTSDNPLLLTQTLLELQDIDTIQVELIPEKKGLFLKHFEYEVTSQEYLPPDIQAQFSASRELIRNIFNSFQKLRDRAERMAIRALGSDTISVPYWATTNNNTWGTLRQSLKGLSVEFAILADKAAQQGKREEDDVVEKLNLFLDLLQSYKDLCERHEKGVLHEHHRALQKYSLMKRQMLSATVQSKEPVSVEQLESRIVQMSEVWNDLQPKLGSLFGGCSGLLSPPLTPQQGDWKSLAFFTN